MVDDKYVGLGLAIASGFGIGSSIVVTKKGLETARQKHGFEGTGHEYIKTPIWWLGMILMALGEFANFAAYAFAPAVLVTPLGALSVLVGAVLGSYILHERLGPLGKIGCAIALIGSIIIVLHAPPDKDVQTVDEILVYAIKPAFLIYCIFVIVFSAVMIYYVAPRYGKTNPLYYLSICASVGSVSVMSIKAFGIALKLSLRGDNQFSHPSTYAFAIVTVVAILTQMNYFNKALHEFTPSIVNALYYVSFTTAVLVASFILFQGFNTTDGVNTISLICGFITIFLGVWLINLSRRDPTGHTFIADTPQDALPADGLAAIQTRYSMQSNRSFDHRRSMSAGSIIYSPRVQDDRQGLMRAYDEESYRLSDLREVSEEDVSPHANGSALANGTKT